MKPFPSQKATVQLLFISCSQRKNAKKNTTVFMVQYYISTLFYNMLLQESVVFLACPAVLRISMTQRKPLKTTRLQPIVVSRFTKRNMDLMQKVYMNLFHLLAAHFAQSVFFSLLILTILGFFGYVQQRASKGHVITSL